MKYNFDIQIDRKGTHSVKTDAIPDGVLPLWVADMDLPCAEPILKALHRRVDKEIFGYTVYDNDRVKDAVYSWYNRRFGWDIDKSWMFFSPGIVPALAFLINVLTEEGDGIVIQKPVYPPFANKIKANKRVVVNNPLIKRGNTYVMNYEDLEIKLADHKNKGMIFCSPHNPVGRVWAEEELHKMVAIAEKYDKWIISDEIHCDITRNGIKHVPLLKAANGYKDRIIACTAPSKTFNLAGIKFSNIIIPNPEYQKIWTEFVYERFSLAICNPFGLEAIVAAYTEGEEWLDQVRDYLDLNIEYVERFVRENLPMAEVIKCEGTYLVLVDLRKYCADPAKLEYAMLNEAKLALSEGYIFGDEGIGYERINVAAPKSNIIKCMDRMKKALNSFL